MEDKKFCPKCGTQAEPNTKFCSKCGYNFDDSKNKQADSEEQKEVINAEPINQENQYTSNGGPRIKNRSIGLCILFSIITCGIYGIYWFIKLTNETNKLTNHPNATSGGLAFLFTLITCGIYGYYWYYQQGSKFKEYYFKKGSCECIDAGVLYLVLAVIVPFIGGIINYSLMQNNLNKILDSK